MAKVRRGDTVEVIVGREKGTRGDVLRVYPKVGRIVIKGINVRKKHQRQVQAGGQTMSPGIIQFEAPINISNVMFVCPSCNERSRLSIRREDGEARRYCKKCDSHVDS
ncbi:MAG: 50S ribosomal protein L24 [Anaerolineales bacterium]